MTIMDRLARKGVVERRKVRPRLCLPARTLTAEEARAQALAQVIENFLAAPRKRLLAHLAPRISLTGSTAERVRRLPLPGGVRRLVRCLRNLAVRT